MLEVLVCIPSYNGWYRVDWLLNSMSLRKDENIDFKILVADDSGKNDHQQKIINVVNKWKMDNRIGHQILDPIINERNLGLAVTWNRLVKSQDAKYYILVNDDIIVGIQWLESMLYFLKNNPHAGSASHFAYFITEEDITTLLSHRDAIVIPRDPFKKTQTEKYNYGLEYPGRCMCPGGHFFGFSKEKYDLVNGFDESYFSFYEETDFGTNLASKGYPSYCLSYSRNWHLWSATFGSAPEINAGRVMQESRAYYTRKWGANGPDVHPRYMSKIPFRKVMFMYKDEEYEKIIDGNEDIDGYYLNDDDRNNVNTLVRIR